MKLPTILVATGLCTVCTWSQEALKLGFETQGDVCSLHSIHMLNMKRVGLLQLVKGAKHYCIFLVSGVQKVDIAQFRLCQAVLGNF